MRSDQFERADVRPWILVNVEYIGFGRQVTFRAIAEIPFIEKGTRGYLLIRHRSPPREAPFRRRVAPANSR